MDFGIPEPGFLSGKAVRAFRLIVAREPVPAELTDAVDELVAWGFVVLDRDRGNRPVALEPGEVARRRLGAELQQAAERVQRMSMLPALTEQLSQAYEAAQWRAGAGSEYIDDVSVVNARLDDVVGSAEWEILSAQPGGPRTDEQLARSLERDNAALDRGVAKRTLYRATARSFPTTAEYVRAMSNRPTGKSAEFCTLPEPFERAIVVDRRVAFISNHLVEGAPEHSAWQITDRAVIAYIVAEFESKWRRADPWSGEAPGRRVADALPSVDGVRTTRRQREIMRDVIAGKHQRVIAGRLGISVRTVSDEITALKDLFDAVSREQLVWKWSHSPDRYVDDSAPEPGASGA
jgi:DNA-binding CsgD family transcriptional regulator